MERLDAALSRAHTAAQAAAQLLRLPFGSRAWRGRAGHWMGASKGSSLDFQDHRPYLPGDDLRHVNWQAYARTGHYSMKLYREEASPAVDVVIDASASMSADDGKRGRTLELALFSLESAREAAAPLAVHAVAGLMSRRLTLEEASRGDFAAPGPAAGRPALEAVPLRAGSLRIVVTDVLFLGAPEDVLAPLSAGGGRAVVLAPSSPAESDPAWAGNVELIDGETGERRPERFDAPRLAAYREAYRRHFDLWNAAALRHGAAFAQVSSAGPLTEALAREAVVRGAVEWIR